MLDEAGVTVTVVHGWMRDALVRQTTGGWAEPLYEQYSVEDAQVEGQPLPASAPAPVAVARAVQILTDRIVRRGRRGSIDPFHPLVVVRHPWVDIEEPTLTP